MPQHYSYPGTEILGICEGKPAGYVVLAWSTDLRKYGISIQQLYNPSNHFLGVSFKKNGKEKSVYFGGDVTEKEVAQAMRSVEKEFGVPKEASKYSKRGD